MADDENHNIQPFNRARNLSNRNFAKRNNNKKRHYLRNDSITITLQHNNPMDDKNIQFDQLYDSHPNHYDNEQLNRLHLNDTNRNINNHNQNNSSENDRENDCVNDCVNDCDNDLMKSTEMDDEEEMDVDPSMLPVNEKVLKFEQLHLELPHKPHKLNNYDNNNNNINDNNKNNYNVTIININHNEGIMEPKSLALATSQKNFMVSTQQQCLQNINGHRNFERSPTLPLPTPASPSPSPSPLPLSPSSPAPLASPTTITTIIPSLLNDQYLLRKCNKSKTYIKIEQIDRQLNAMKLRDITTDSEINKINKTDKIDHIDGNFNLMNLQRTNHRIRSNAIDKNTNTKTILNLSDDNCDKIAIRTTSTIPTTTTTTTAAAVTTKTKVSVKTSDPISSQSLLSVPNLKHSVSCSAEYLTNDTASGKTQNFIRNYRCNPRPKTEIIDMTASFLTEPQKYNSLNKIEINDDSKSIDDIELRDKGVKSVEPILEELIKTEETYVDNLWTGINNYAPIFQRPDLPPGLRGKKYILLGNVEQLAEFHRDEFLPMLKRQRHNLKGIFEEFIQFIDENCFYGYVLFTINKKHSLQLCETYKNYFKMIQNELDDKLGINSFLVQPIQRMARYPLLLQQFITTLFKNRLYDMKPIIETCCRLEKRLRNLLTMTNESEIINDIVCSSETSDFNVLYQGKFRKVSEFNVYDHTRKRSYRSKVFMFDMCIVYTEIKGKQLIYQGRYPCEHIGIVTKAKSFTLYYDQRRQQECDFHGDTALIEMWLDLIRDMITVYAAEERRKLIDLIHKDQFKTDHGSVLGFLGQPPNLSLFRDSNRFSSDSGIGNIWVLPKPDLEEISTSTNSPNATPTPTTNRTTWYAVT